MVSEEEFENLVEKVDELEEKNKKLRDKVNLSESDKSETNNHISRRRFLKKAGIGAMGLGALAMIPVSALQVKDDRFNVQTGTDASSLSEAMNIDSSGNVSIGALNGADIQNASSGQVLKSDGDGTLSMGSVGGVPSGLIAMWSGSPSNVPDGWTLCDGSDGAPDLQDRFVVGAGNSYSVDDTGGSDSVSLSVSQLPSHDHGSGSLEAGNHNHNVSLTSSQAGSHSHDATFIFGDGDDASVEDSINYGGKASTGQGPLEPAGSHTHNITGSTDSASPLINGSTGATGSGNSHENRPPYYALAFIMKK